MRAGAHSSITHKNGANNNFDALISSIDVARQDFVTECELMREFSRTSMGPDAFRDFVDEVYNIDEGQVFRKREKLERAFINPVTVFTFPRSLSGVALMPSQK